ncbi:hypothetical protein [Flavobacterium dankookense]|uniref:Uncharacterized protein n=1 Tax=Flavobacterium dankookense TaxID=706186 RepID=A0A4R6QGN5_9FLAO|nr:hypothetical protein [Flavobacterium dankookense]TDP61133.1 hypothetical protein BC748_0746 [Flavobacterium dankookense]
MFAFFHLKRILFFALLFLTTSYAQEKAIDSLKTALRNPKLHETTKLQMIHNVARTKFTNNFDPKFHQVVDMLGDLALKNYNKKQPVTPKKIYIMASYLLF